MVDPRDDDQLNILVIDDEEGLRQLLLAVLLPLEHQVFAVGSAEEGLELLPLYTFHLAFLDQNLPGMEGLVLGEYLRRNNPHMKVALVTGSDDPRLERLGAAHQITVIRKPFQVKQILDVIDAFRTEARERSRDEEERSSPDFDPSFSKYLERITERFAPLNIPERASERIVQVVRDALAQLKSARRYDEEDRVVALAGLIAMEVLGIKPPKDRALREEYDELMAKHGRRREFEPGS
jgi:CheY-like chemotaxis protein